jgi:hypothetical protein
LSFPNNDSVLHNPPGNRHKAPAGAFESHQEVQHQ